MIFRAGVFWGGWLGRIWTHHLVSRGRETIGHVFVLSLHYFTLRLGWRRAIPEDTP